MQCLKVGKEKAAPNLPVRKMAATRSVTGSYHQPCQCVKGPLQIYAGRRDRRPPHPPATVPSSNIAGSALALLLTVLALQAGDFSRQERQRAVGVADSLAREIVSARLAEGVR